MTRDEYLLMRAVLNIAMLVLASCILAWQFGWVALAVVALAIYVKPTEGEP